MLRRQLNRFIVYPQHKYITGVVLVACLTICSLLNVLSGQDLVFSQYYSTPMHFNSAFAGRSAYPVFSANHRTQWPGFSKTYVTYGVSYDQAFPDKNLGIGLLALTDNQADGTLKTTKFKGIISYNLKINRGWQIKFGVGTAFVQNALDWEKLVFFDQLDPQFGAVDRFGNANLSSEIQPPSLSNSYFDLDMGLLLYSKKYYAGFSFFHANGPYDGFTAQVSEGVEVSIPVLLTLHGGYQVTLQQDSKGHPTSFISPNILVATQSGFTQINAGAYIQKNAIFGGLWMRHTIENLDAIIFSAGVQVGQMKIGYSFDMTTAQLGLQNSGGSHEISISIGLKHLEKKESPYNDCFAIFR